MSAAAAIRTTLVGVDATAAAFASVDKRASAAMGKARRMAMTALGGIAAAFSVGAMKSAFDEMGNLTDMAQLASTSTSEIQKLSGALDQAGVKNVNIDTLASAFAKMSKNTGAVGMTGFKDTLAQISKIGDEGKRMEALTRIFGRELGASFAPIVRNGPEAFKASLQSVMDMMPGLPQAAAEAGDRASDGLKLAGAMVKNEWHQAMADVVWAVESLFGDNIGVVLVKTVAGFTWLGSMVMDILSTMTANVIIFTNALADMSFDNVEWASFEFDKVNKAYDDTVTKARKGMEAQNKLASGASDATASIAEKAIDRMANKLAEFGDASSYATVQAAYGSGGMGYRAPQILNQRPPEIDSSVGAAVRETGLTQERLLENMVEETKRTREILESLGVI